MITIPTTELIGCLADVLPQISDEKSALAGVRIEWDGESLHFTTYDVLSGATVLWTPGEGPEEEAADDEEDIRWGGDDAPWATWIWLASAKEILKLFKLPAKLWRVPVTVKCSTSRDRLIIERTDSPRGERLLTVPADPEQLKNIPDVRAVADRVGRQLGAIPIGAAFTTSRLGAFGAVRPHAGLTLHFGADGDPVGIHVGSRFAGFIYQAGARNVRPFNLLRDGAGVVTSN